MLVAQIGITILVDETLIERYVQMVQTFAQRTSGLTTILKIFLVMMTSKTFRYISRDAARRTQQLSLQSVFLVSWKSFGYFCDQIPEFSTYLITIEFLKTFECCHPSLRPITNNQQRTTND